VKKILIVDDVRSWREYHRIILKELLGEFELYQADSAKSAYDLLMEHNETPFDIIITDLQMESDFEPLYAGEWLVKQIKTFKNYSKTRVVISSATYNIRTIAENSGVECIPKSTAQNFPDAYSFLK